MPRSTQARKIRGDFPVEVTARGLKGRGSGRVRKDSSQGILELGQKPREESGAGSGPWPLKET